MEEEKKWNIYMVTMKMEIFIQEFQIIFYKDFETHCNEKGAKCLRGKGPLKLSWFSKANSSQCAFKM